MRYLRGEIENNRIRIKVGIRAFNPDPNTSVFDYQEFTALVDTGAQRTCVTQNVVDRLGLVRRGRVPVGNVKRVDYHYTYLFHVGIWPESEDGVASATFGIGDEIEGFDLGDSRYFDVLLGMDIITKGSLKIERSGKFEMAFPN